MHVSRLKWLLPAVAMVLLTAIIAGRQGRRVNDNVLKNASESTEWLTYGHSFSEQRYSPLTQIDKGNVGRLGLACSIDIEPGGGPQAATPLSSKGVLYGITNCSITLPVYARTVKEILRYDPQFHPLTVRH